MTAMWKEKPRKSLETPRWALGICFTVEEDIPNAAEDFTCASRISLIDTAKFLIPHHSENVHIFLTTKWLKVYALKCLKKEENVQEYGTVPSLENAA